MKRVCFLAIMLLALTASGVYAQEFRGSISGRVTDSSKGRLPGATVTITNVATNVATTTGASTPPGYGLARVARNVRPRSSDATNDVLCEKPGCSTPLMMDGTT